MFKLQQQEPQEEASQEEDEAEEDNEPKAIIVRDINDQFIYNSVGERVYWNKPFCRGQFNKEGMRKLGPPITKIFKLNDPEQLKEYNDLIKQVGAEGDDPSIVIVYHDRQFYAGGYIALVTYNEVWYLLPKQG